MRLVLRLLFLLYSKLGRDQPRFNERMEKIVLQRPTNKGVDVLSEPGNGLLLENSHA